MTKICAIHQPNFLPWLPYFDKISQADVFVFLDEVDYPKSSKSMGSWCNRVKIKMNRQDLWFSCPVVRESGTQLIKNMKINYDEIHFKKWLSTLRCAYGKNDNFDQIWGMLEEAYKENHSYLADFNVSLISKICVQLKVKTNFVRQSYLVQNNLQSNDMLIDLCKQVGASSYLSGMGSMDYMDGNKFTASGIDVQYQSQLYRSDIEEMKKYSVLHFLMTTDPRKWQEFNAKI